MYYKWSKDFLEAGKKRLRGDTEREANTKEVQDLREENKDLKEVVAELTLDNRMLKKKLEWSKIKFKKYMRFTAKEKMEIIRLVEQSDWSVRKTLKQIGIHKSTFYNWYSTMPSVKELSLINTSEALMNLPKQILREENL